VKISVVSTGKTEFKAEGVDQEQPIGIAIATGDDGLIRSEIMDCTEGERADLRHDAGEYVTVTEDDGTPLWSGWLDGRDEMPPAKTAEADGRPREALGIAWNALMDIVQQAVDKRTADTAHEALRAVSEHMQYEITGDGVDLPSPPVRAPGDTSPGTPVYLATIAHLAAALSDIRDANPDASAGAYVCERASLALRALPPGFAGAGSLRDTISAVAALRSVRADEFARVKVRLCALIASLDETVSRGAHAEEFDQGAAHASAVTARQLRAILEETAMGTTPWPAPADPDCTVCAQVGGPHGVPQSAPEVPGA
jgi:hypothetical protein